MGTNAQTNIEMSQLYVALFGRAPDSEGLAFWAALRNSGQSVAELANAMFGTAPARAYFPEGLGAQEVIASFYLNVLGRVADSEGLLFWTGKLDAAGATAGSVTGEMINVVAGYSGTDPLGLFSAALFNNRSAAARFYAEHGGSVDNAQSVLAAVTDIPATVAQARVLALPMISQPAYQVGGFGEVVLGAITQDITLQHAGADVQLTFAVADPDWLYARKAAVQLHADTDADVLNLKFDVAYADEQGPESWGHYASIRLDAGNVESMNVISGSRNTAQEAGTEYMVNMLELQGSRLEHFSATGHETIELRAAPTMTHLTVIDAHGIAGDNFNGYLGMRTAAYLDASRILGGAGIAITGSATSTSTILGSGKGDKIVGGSDHDFFQGGLGADVITGGGGHDHFFYVVADESKLLAMDTITDFHPNTVYLSGGAVPEVLGAPYDRALWDGDVIRLPTAHDFIFVTTGKNKAEALEKLPLGKGTALDDFLCVTVALDTSTGVTYIDFTSDGTPDMAIKLPGVTTITAAAFL